MGLLCGQGKWGAHGRSQGRPSQAHLSLSFLDLHVALTLPPSEESLPALPFTPFQASQPQAPDEFSGPCERPSRVLFPGLTEFSAAWAVTGLVLRADRN